MFALRVTLVDSAEWRGLWAGLAALTEFDTDEVDALARVARAGLHAHFRAEQSPTGAPWHPLAPMTQEQRAQGIDERGIPFAVGPDHPILFRTGDLLAAFTNPQHPQNLTQSGVFNAATVLVLGATDAPNAPGRIRRLQQGGVTHLGTPVPARPFIGISPETATALAQTASGIIYQRLARLNG